MQEEYVFSVRYRIIDPGTLKSSKDSKFICLIYAYVKAEDTKVNEDLTIMLDVVKQDTLKECEDWVGKTSKYLGQWYLDVKLRDFLKSNLTDENFKYLLDEETKLKTEIKHA